MADFWQIFGRKMAGFWQNPGREFGDGHAMLVSWEVGRGGKQKAVGISRRFSFLIVKKELDAEWEVKNVCNKNQETHT